MYNDVSKRYRQVLREYLNQGSFAREPKREKLMRKYLDEWDKWSEIAQKQSRLLDIANKYLWFGLLPSVFVMLYAILRYEKSCRAQYQRLESSQREFLEYGHKHGMCRVEEEATERLQDDLKGFVPKT